MPIAVTEFEEKRYVIADVEFRLRKPTLGIKRRGAALNEVLAIKAQELVAISKKYHQKSKEYDPDDEIACQELCELANKVTKTLEELYIKAEDFLKIVLEPINPEDKEKLTADNLDSEEMIAEVQQDFFQYAGMSIKPANNYKKRSRS